MRDKVGKGARPGNALGRLPFGRRPVCFMGRAARSDDLHVEGGAHLKHLSPHDVAALGRDLLGPRSADLRWMVHERRFGRNSETVGFAAVHDLVLAGGGAAGGRGAGGWTAPTGGGG